MTVQMKRKLYVTIRFWGGVLSRKKQACPIEEAQNVEFWHTLNLWPETPRQVTQRSLEEFKG